MAVIHVVAGGMDALGGKSVFHQRFLPQFFIFYLRFFYAFITSQNFRFFRFKLFLGAGLVLYRIAQIAAVNAENAILAVAHIKRKQYIHAFLQALTEEALEGLPGVQAFIAKFGII